MRCRLGGDVTCHLSRAHSLPAYTTRPAPPSFMLHHHWNPVLHWPPASSSLRPPPHSHATPRPILTPLRVPFPSPAAQAQTSTSCGPGVAAGAVTLMSKQVTIMTWALHRFTCCSRAAVARSRATRYSADSGSSSGSTSTAGGQQAAGQGQPRRAKEVLLCPPGFQVPVGPRGRDIPPHGKEHTGAPGGERPAWGAGTHVDGFLQACASRRGVSVLQPAEGGLTLLQPAARLHHQPALCLGQLLAEQLMPGLDVPQPLLPALSQPQLRTDAHQALDSRWGQGGLRPKDSPPPRGYRQPQPWPSSLYPPGLGRSIVGSQRWAWVGPGPHR